MKKSNNNFVNIEDATVFACLTRHAEELRKVAVDKSISVKARKQVFIDYIKAECHFAKDENGTVFAESTIRYIRSMNTIYAPKMLVGLVNKYTSGKSERAYLAKMNSEKAYLAKMN